MVKKIGSCIFYILFFRQLFVYNVQSQIRCVYTATLLSWKDYGTYFVIVQGFNRGGLSIENRGLHTCICNVFSSYLLLFSIYIYISFAISIYTDLPWRTSYCSQWHGSPLAHSYFQLNVGNCHGFSEMLMEFRKNIMEIHEIFPVL